MNDEEQLGSAGVFTDYTLLIALSNPHNFHALQKYGKHVSFHHPCGTVLERSQPV